MRVIERPVRIRDIIDGSARLCKSIDKTRAHTGYVPETYVFHLPESSPRRGEVNGNVETGRFLLSIRPYEISIRITDNLCTELYLFIYLSRNITYIYFLYIYIEKLDNFLRDERRNRNYSFPPSLFPFQRAKNSRSRDTRLCRYTGRWTAGNGDRAN